MIVWLGDGVNSKKTRTRRRAYGPISEGVTDSERGGGKLIKVGVDMFLQRYVDCLKSEIKSKDIKDEVVSREMGRDKREVVKKRATSKEAGSMRNGLI